MYQSLHTTLIGPEGHPFEIQIRTFEMHRVAEYGIAAHWKYKENNNTKGLNKEEEKLSWLREVLEWQRDMDDNKEFLSLLKTNLDLFAEQVYCFTPNGDVKTLRMVRHRSILHIQSIVQSVIRWLEPGQWQTGTI